MQKEQDSRIAETNEFNISAKRPKVLLLGNGITRKNSKNDTYSLQKVVNKWCGLKGADFSDVPFTILTMVFGKEKKDLVSLLNKKRYTKNNNLKDFLSLGFDAILTANYTYEIENEIDKNYVKKSDKQKLRNAVSYYKDKDGKPRRENNKMIQTFNRLNDENNREFNIWHIHGELRNSQSLVLTHDDYEKLTTKIGNYLNNRYSQYANNKSNYSFESWIDYLLFGDVFIVGLGLYFSEYDLWWLLNERKKRKINNNIVYYEPCSDEKLSIKQKMLEQIGVKVKHLGAQKPPKGKFDFKDFYSKVIDDVRTYL